MTPQESTELIKDNFDVKAFNEVEFTPISKRLIFRFLLMPILPIIAVITLIGVLAGFSLKGWLVVIIVFGFMMFLAYKRWGYYFTDDYVYIRKGLFGIDYLVFPVSKLQQIAIKQSVFMRPHKLANLQYVLASGGYRIPMMPIELAQNQTDKALLLVERDKPNWM